MIVKWGDDLRQELLCSQLLEQFKVGKTKMSSIFKINSVQNVDQSSVSITLCVVASSACGEHVRGVITNFAVFLA